ncbi:DUF7159 family protein [Mycobacterium sp. IDR2000157661]|uniref:DUF7159 family protein n=1 Tax=Mycobacterium sp. IDR2000157661 TaxID=2867005 RepID=UPI001EEC87AB|nr:hypothetical protein [Mycobacterium sp. IDR2000157661]ULE32516.1 hypothetical protein K3G64_20795 [Mycobacterium sp. IDR2000157661]
MKTVLGLSMTSNSVSWVLLDDPTADATTLDHDHFDVVGDTVTDGDITRHESAVRGAQAIAAASGHEVITAAVTWTKDVEAKAALLLTSLADMGFETVCPVPLPEAARVWAGTYGRDLGLDRCAVCVVESAAVTVASVLDDTARTARTQMRDSADGLGRWLSESFDKMRAEPQSLLLIGSRGDLELIAGPLEEGLHVPVVASDDAQLALARGAALKTAEAPAVSAVGKLTTVRTRYRQARRYRFGPRSRAAIVLAAAAFALFAVGPEPAGPSEPADSQNWTTAGTSDLAPAADTSTSAISVHAVPSPRALTARPASPVVATAPVAAPEVVPDVVTEPMTEPLVPAVEAPVEAVEAPVEAAAEAVEAQPVAVAPAPVTVQPAAAAPASHGAQTAMSLPGPSGSAPGPAGPATPANPLPQDPLTATLSPILGGLP